MTLNCGRVGSVDIAVVWLMCTCVGIIAALTAAPLALLWFGLVGVSTSKYLTMIEDRQTALDEIKLELF